MTGCHLLHIDAAGLSAYRRQHGQLERTGQFAADEAGRNAFSTYLAASPNAAFRILADLGDEELVLDSIPFLRGRDRQKLLARRMQQRLGDTALHMTFSLGQHTKKRKEENVLLAGLGKPQLLAPWLACLDAGQAAVAGIHSLLQLDGRLLKRLGFPATPSLLLAEQDQRLRQCYLNRGLVVFSRTTGLAAPDAAGAARQMLDEALRLQHYLATQRLIEPTARPPVHLLASPEIAAILQSTAPDPEQLHCVITDTASAARRLQLRRTTGAPGYSELALHLLALSAPHEQFAPSTQRRTFRLWQIRRALHASSFGLLFASALLAGAAYWQAQALQQENLADSARALSLQQRYAAIASRFPRLDIDHDALRRLTARHQELARQQATPGPLFYLLAAALDANPTVELDELLWENPPPGQSTAGTAEPGGEKLGISGKLHGEASAGLRQSQAAFAQFLTALQRMPDITVQVSRAAHALTAGQALRSSELADPEAGRFALRLVRQAQP